MNTKFGDTIECPTCGTKITFNDVLCPECNAELGSIDNEGIDRVDTKHTLGSTPAKNIITVATIRCLACNTIYTARWIGGDNPYFPCPRCGMHETMWNGKDHNGKEVGSGVYIVTVEAGSKMETKAVGVMNK